VISVKLCVTILNYTEFHRDHTEMHRENQIKKACYKKQATKLNCNY